MTLRRALLLALLPLTLSCAKIGATNSSGSTQTDIELTGIDSFDSLFREARDVDERVDGARTAMKSGRTNLNSALGLSEGTPFADAVTELRSRAEGKLKVVVEDGGGLKIEPTDALPSNLAAAVDSLNSTLADYKAAIADITGAKEDAQSLVDATKKFPSQLQSDFKSFDLSLNELPTKLETVRNNVRIIGNMPSRIDKLAGAMNDNLTLVRDVMQGKKVSSSASSSSAEEEESSGSSGGTRTLGR